MKIIPYGYKTLLIDPPWNETGGGKIRRGADRHYALMKTADIMALPVQRLIHSDGCHLYLWVTNNHLRDGLVVMEKYGFEFKSIITWHKRNSYGLGQYFRGCTEHVLFGVTPKRLPYKVESGKRQQGVTGFIADRRAHSRKPEELRRMVERVSYPPYCELFAREQHDGWACIGNKITGTDIHKVLMALNTGNSRGER